MPSLYQLTDQYRAIEEAAYNDELSYDEFAAMLEAVEDDIERKVDGYCRIIAHLKSDAQALKDEEARIKARQRGLEGSIEHLKNALSVALDAQGKSKIKTNLYTVYYASRTGLEITELDAVPEEYIKPHVRSEKDVDKKSITALLLETGEVMPWARLVKGRSLNIR